MRYILIIIVFISVIGCTKRKTDINNKKTYVNPPTFVLTEMNGRELEKRATFIIKYDNTFELKTGDGKVFKYIPYKHIGNDPLCNILAKDFRDKPTEICIKTESNSEVLIMLEKDKIANFKGYRK